MTKLSVNLNKVALLRNQRDIGYPSVVEAARLVIGAGAHGITVHPRPDERHIRRSDVLELATVLRRDYGGRVEFNVEGNPTPDFLSLIETVRPTQVTLVPDAPDQHTSDHGWDMAADEGFVTDVVARLKAIECRVSLFLDPEPALVPAAARSGADRIELYTEPYAVAHGGPDQEPVLRQFLRTAEAARAHDVGVNAGHDLNLENLPDLIVRIPWILEVSIGHAITADALRSGFVTATRDYLRALDAVPLGSVAAYA